jgi:hypothetical protein
MLSAKLVRSRGRPSDRRRSGVGLGADFPLFLSLPNPGDKFVDVQRFDLTYRDSLHMPVVSAPD